MQEAGGEQDELQRSETCLVSFGGPNHFDLNLVGRERLFLPIFAQEGSLRCTMLVPWRRWLSKVEVSVSLQLLL